MGFMKRTIWTQTYTVNSFLVNPQKKLGLMGLLNLLQDTAWVHATHLGHGYEKMIEEGSAWVLTRQKVAMRKWPHWGEEITFKTWIRPIKGVVAIRDFEIWCRDEKIGECTTQWLILDLATRRATERGGKSFEGQWREDAPDFLEVGKISPSKDAQKITEFQVRNSDLDLNGHVNNTRYAQWILDSISLQKHQDHVLTEYEVNFVAETMSGDTIEIQRAPLSEQEFLFQGRRSEDQKMAFVAKLKVSAQQLPP